MASVSNHAEGKNKNPLRKSEAVKKLGKAIRQKYLQSFAIAALWMVEVACVSK